MELEYQLAELIAKAKTHDQYINALRAFEVTSFRLNTDETKRMLNLLAERHIEITKQEKEHLDLAFSIRKEFGIQNNIVKPVESDGTPVITDFTDEAITADNVAKVASTLILK